MKNLLFSLIASLMVITSMFAQSPEELYRASLKAVNDKDYDKGIELMDQFIKENPDFKNLHQIYLNRASAKSLLNRHTEAIIDIDKAIKLEPTYAESYRKRGFVKKEQGKFEEALADYNKALEIDPSLSNTYVNKGLVLDTLGRKEEACKSFEWGTKVGADYAPRYLSKCDSSSPVLKKYMFHILVDKSNDDTYGLTVQNPIKVGHGPQGQRAYLDLLRDSKGKPVKYERIGNAGMYPSSHGFMGMASVDSYEVIHKNDKGKKKKTTLYLSFYDYEEPRIPVGFYGINDFE